MRTWPVSERLELWPHDHVVRVISLHIAVRCLAGYVFRKEVERARREVLVLVGVARPLEDRERCRRLLNSGFLCAGLWRLVDADMLREKSA